ncbi:cytochrome P450 2G1-like [Pelodytes ibericus]
MVLTWVEILLLVLICCSFSYSTWNSMYRNRNLPPGTPPLPFIGNLLQIERGQMVNSLMKLWKRYGSVYTLYFGSRPVIVLCGYEAVKEALVDHGDEFGGRGTVATLDKFACGYGIGLSNGERWRQMRIFTLKTLRNFGMGKKSIEEKIKEEVHFLIKDFRGSKEMPIDPFKKLGNAIANILCSIIFGNCFEYTDEKFAHLLGIVDKIFSVTSSSYGQLQNIFPKLMDYVPGPHQKMCSISEELNYFLYERVKKNQENLDPNYPRDFIDCCLIKMEEEKDNPDTEFTMRNVLMTLFTLMLGGSETSNTVLKHGFRILLTFPEIQGKRICPGEGLARMEMFLYLTMILQTFTLTSQRQFTEADIAPSMEGQINAPIPYQLSFVSRSH